MNCIHPFGHRNWTRIIFFQNHGFDPFLSHLWPIFNALLALRGAKIAQHGLTIRSFHLFVHPQ